MPSLVLAVLLLDAGAAAAGPFVEAGANAPRIKSGAYALDELKAVYSDADKAAGRRGNVIVRAVVGPDGSVGAVEVVRSNAPVELETAALTAVHAQRFRPARDGDRAPLASIVVQRLVFSAPGLDPDYEVRNETVYDPAERAQGHYGKVVVAAEIGADGKLVNPRVDSSSLAPALDAEALRAATASTYRPYHDGAGKPIKSPIKVGYAFDSYHSPGEGGGILRYNCDQFARDQIWWNSVHAPEDRSEIYLMILGLGSLSFAPTGNPNAMLSYAREFEGRWNKAIKSCQAKPGKLFIDVFKPEGDMARRLALAPVPKDAEGN